MDGNKGFQRIFLIFASEDAGYEAGQKPAGHVRIEMRDGKGKLHAAVQNLRPANGRFEYRLYLIKSGRDSVATMVGQLFQTTGSASLEWSFDPKNVGMTGIGIDQFDVAAVLAEYGDSRGDAGGRQRDAVICPLAAYKQGRKEWRNGFNAAAQGQTAQQDDPTEKEQAELLAKAGQHTEPMLQPEIEEQPATIEQPEMVQQPELLLQPEQVAESVYEQQEPADRGMFYDQAPAENIGGAQIDTGCVYLNGNICNAFITGNAGAAGPCSTCSVHKPVPVPAPPPAGDVMKLREELSRQFEFNDPFHSRRSDYTWWKVTNPVNLNNLLYQCGIRSPLLFNPAVMLAHYKYRHLIIGIYQKKPGLKQYVVCGVPGMHMVDRKPFGEMSRWLQAEGSRPRYGAFGFWLVYIDPDDGKILNMSQE